LSATNTFNLPLLLPDVKSLHFQTKSRFENEYVAMKFGFLLVLSLFIFKLC
jgi:hypothetical protein